MPGTNGAELAEMEMAGIQVDRQTLSRMSGAFAQKMAALEEENVIRPTTPAGAIEQPLRVSLERRVSRARSSRLRSVA